MSTNYVQEHQHLQERLAQLGKELTGPMTGFAIEQFLPTAIPEMAGDKP